MTGRTPRGPALQNIPLRTEMGRQLREAFTTRPVLNVDYASLEKRVEEEMRRNNDGDEPHTLGHAKVLAETDKALQVQVKDLKQTVWIPKSVIHDDSEVFNSTSDFEGELFVKRWFARKEGWAE